MTDISPPSRHEVQSHEQDISILLDALREIANPLPEWYKRSVARGYKLDGHAAVMMSLDPNTFRGIAEKAIRDYQNR